MSTKMDRSPAITVAALTIFFGGRSASATSIIIDIKPDRVIILADSRAVVVNAGSKTVRDDMCKIVSLGGRLGFAETGREGYTPSGPLDLAPEWNGRAEALSAYRSVQNGDFYGVVLNWSIKVTNKFQ